VPESDVNVGDLTISKFAINDVSYFSQTLIATSCLWLATPSGSNDKLQIKIETDNNLLMKQQPIVVTTLLLILFSSCQPKTRQPTNDLVGTWKLISGTLIEHGDTTITNYTERPFIKIINDSHFAFLNHDVNKGKLADSLFVAGGGRYELRGDQYTEHLEYCSDREWERNDFSFTVKIQNDTLIQTGVEKVDAKQVNRLNIEKYVRVISHKL
jgi:hypothetical protein